MVTSLKPRTSISPDNSIGKAKKVNILNLLLEFKGYSPLDPYRTGKIMMLCPLHEETTPSFCIYTKTNSWNCFAGCGGGSSIDLYMKLHDVDFKTAVERLNGN